MVSAVGKICVGVGAFVSSGVVGVGLWTQSKSSHLEEDRRGSVVDRCRETIVAALTKNNIGDKNTRAGHVALVASLSSKSYAKKAASMVEEQLHKLATSYFAGYLFKVVEEDAEERGIPVFKFTDNLGVCLPRINGQPYSGFIFSGETARLFDHEAREQIIDEKYVRCSAAIPRNVHGMRDSQQEVIISGTTDCEKCRELSDTFFRDLVWVAAVGDGISPQHPLSDTPVFEIKKNNVQPVGDLSEFPESAKDPIRRLNFTACPFYTLQKTRLSRGTYKEVGAVITGIDNPQACEALQFDSLRKLLARTKGSK
jgi:hypothetical protein